MHGEVGKLLTRMGVGFWLEVILFVETTLLPRTMLFEIWLRSPSVEIAEPDDAGRLTRSKKELWLAPALVLCGEVRAGHRDGETKGLYLIQVRR